MALTNINQKPFLILLIILSINVAVLQAQQVPCLDQNQPIDQCTNCTGGNIIIQSRCFQAMRGCLNYTYLTESENIQCAICQNGYVFLGDICERQAVVNSQNLPPGSQVDNSPAPIAPDSAGKLTPADILSSYRQKNNGNSSISSNNQTQTKQPQFPSIIIHQANILQQLVKQPSKQKTLKDFPQSLQKQILVNFPYLQKISLISVNNFKNINQNIQQGIQKYQFGDGTQILMFSQQETHDVIGFNKNKQIQATFKYFQDHLKMQVVNIKPSINYVIEYGNQKTIIKDQNGYLSCLQYQQGQQPSSKQLSSKIIKQLQSYKNEQKTQQLLHFYLNIAYKEYINIIKIVNIPSEISQIQAIISSNSGKSKILFKIDYEVENNEEYTLIQYGIELNQTTIRGYYIGNQNILQISQLNPVQNNNNTEQVKPTQTIQSPTKPTDPTDPTSITEYQFPKFSEQNIIQYFKNNPSLQKLVKDNYHIISIIPHSSERTYQVIILVPEGRVQIILSVKQDNSLTFLDQNMITISESTCSNLQLDDKITKLSLYLRNNYKMLADYPEVIAQQKIQMDSTYYRLLYVNDKLQSIEFIIQNQYNSQKYSMKSPLLNNQGFGVILILNNGVKLAETLVNQTSQLKQYQPHLTKLHQAYSKYLGGALIEGILGNKTHQKIYYQTEDYSLESLYDLNSKKVILKALQKKQSKNQSLLQKRGSPPGFTQDSIIYPESQDIQVVQQIEQKIINKYQYYLRRDYEGFIAQKLTSEDSKDNNYVYEIVFKSGFGYFKIDVKMNQKTNSPITYGALSRIQQWPVNSNYKKLPKQIVKCDETTQNYDVTQNICLPKITNCKKQIGGICIICEKYYFLTSNKKSCIIDCSETI